MFGGSGIGLSQTPELCRSTVVIAVCQSIGRFGSEESGSRFSDAGRGKCFELRREVVYEDV